MDLIWLKETACPVCGSKFQSENIRQNKLMQVTVDEDFHPHFEPLSPLYYSVVVCPDCYYAERRQNFEELKGKTLGAVKAGGGSLRQLGAGFNFRSIRNFALSIKSFELGALTAQIKSEPSDVIGGMFLRAAWTCRESGDESLENVYLRKTLEYYEKAYMNEATEFGQLGTCGFQYMMGEIYRRLGNLEKALELYMRSVANKEIRQKPQVERLAREQLAAVKAKVKP
ncbi:DUF2225 domain-containing protein [bacterium]|nr:DUF2225 domain-containing protein [bacterium]